MRQLATLATAIIGLAGCGSFGSVVDPRAPWEHHHTHDVGRPVLSHRWNRTIADHSTAMRPQEFADVAVAVGGSAEASDGRGTLFVGSHDGTFYALSARDGSTLWKREIGSVSGQPLLTGDLLFVGTDDGVLFALTPETGEVRWQYQAKGAILRPPVASGDTLVFSTDVDKVFALDRTTGKWRWQYERETPEAFTIRGHAGVTVVDDHVYAGFADGHVVALGLGGGEVLWVRSLAGAASQFIDIDTTPVVRDGSLYAASTSGGLYALAAIDGTEQWHTSMQGADQLILDGDRLYAIAAEEGVFALDLRGHVLWRQGLAKAGDPARPVISDRYLFLAMSDGGLFIVDKRDGTLLQSFDPGNGISSSPALMGGQLFLLSNGGVLYAMNVYAF